jgi:hypothetical protein
MKLKRMGRGRFRSFMPEVISPLRRAMTTADQSRSRTSRLRCSSSRRNSVIALPALRRVVLHTHDQAAASPLAEVALIHVHYAHQQGACGPAVNASRATRISSYRERLSKLSRAFCRVWLSCGNDGLLSFIQRSPIRVT